ncbi:gamma-glutamylputrescine oxidase [Pseudochelatococcus lubricantis]|uniref:Gamma-glutamylputrescine oxidase n=1 Tax=Pseudochelatococcus lubricantis TaxID=1538102 RepID=A0ABX0V532_9HYPH|nr:FAD-binding oxidoreductase [Pseudochelatococcus lubricantis]NIJ59609.1 gamma-glutamylputrescine oxidase [Pseudochelatococcus lubricantis]
MTNLYAERADARAPRPAVAGDILADVCVVGAGFTGLGAALTLARAGVDVRVVEASRVGGGASGVNGGQVHPGQRREQAWLEARVGEARARELWQIAEEARLWLGDIAADIDNAASLAGDGAGGCDLRPGLLLLAHRARHFRALAEDAEHLARHYGVAGLEVLDARAVEKYTHMRGCHGGVFNPHGGHLDPLALARGLARLAEAAGARLHEQSRVLRVAREGDLWRVATEAGAVRARAVLLTGDGSLDPLSEVTAAHVMPLVNFMIATAPLDPALADTVLAGAIAASDTRCVVNYFRRTDDNRIIFGGGESYGADLPADFAARVRRRMLVLYPQLATAAITHGWGGRLGVTSTRLPFVRRLEGGREDGLYVASGFSGQGVMLGPYTGRLIAEAIVGDTERFDRMTALPVPELPGGRWLRRPLLTAAMIGFGLLDKL